jgi:hypothetical protein
MESQSELILRYLQAGNKLTPLDALRLFGCLRLGARIWDLRQGGHQIAMKIVETASGKHVAEYHLLDHAQRNA